MIQKKIVIVVYFILIYQLNVKNVMIIIQKHHIVKNVKKIMTNQKIAKNV